MGVHGTGGPGAAAPSVGVEEEFLLVDAVSGKCVPGAGGVLAEAGAHRWAGSGGSFQAELLTSQVEAATGVCRDLAGLGEQLRFGRARLAAAARSRGALLVASGTPVLDGRPPPPAPGDRFAAIMAAFGDVVEDYQACGCHVHVGVPGREAAVAVVNHLRPWLPVLLALSANSPFDHGRASGHAARRIVEMARFPGAGVPPWSATAAEWDARVAALVEAGVLVDASMTFWLARPSPRWPTVEVRAADAAATADEAVLQAALVRGLVGAALADLAAGREAPRADGQLCAAALWSAARHGLDCTLADPVARRPVPAWRLVDDLVARAAPALEDTGDLATVFTLLEALRRAGTGADRQRRAARAGGPRAVVEMLARQTRSGRLTGSGGLTGFGGGPSGGAPDAPPEPSPPPHETHGEETGVWDARERVPEPDAPRTDATLTTEDT
ncbi:carboxylate-amine ligase [Actinomadura bangladeshensis]|uniref:Putative glutamate--cysteine ligase 2 n=1 Tax=Actinomadura bangladeshensis TaxID=453573 RepID=A0A4R4N3D6_9ACTN|nr:glutamate--cysteine ligase [Actinomadura bangladeshensis]TDC01500.1 YbdK family carboxylate-amine ligase [Actinomadura bangladeshensis]